ncbi:NUDIX domain-containing protein [Niveibacterium sp. SC-1]|uniref:NUDIX hydrolase n=1 Tax=Niveibacterium sp. SC-1 TaxID=3135646 RepID=UPI00311EE6D6
MSRPDPRTAEAYPNIICTVDVVLLVLRNNALHVALLKREQMPFKGRLALPGGYIHAQEDGDAEASAARVLREKAGVSSPYLEQLGSFSGARRDPRGWSVSLAYYALVAPDLLSETAHPELAILPVDALPEPLPFDHARILAAAVERLRAKSQYSSLPCHLAGEAFTLPELQQIYEAVMGSTINKVSFRRKMDEMDMLEAVPGAQRADGPFRPAQLYRLKPAFRTRLKLINRGF